MPISIESRCPLGIIVSIVEPVGSSDSLVSVDFQDNIGDVVAPCCEDTVPASFSEAGLKTGPGFFQFFADLGASLGLILDDIQDAVLGESRYIRIHIEEIQGKQITGLKIFNLGTVFRVAADIGVGEACRI